MVTAVSNRKAELAELNNRINDLSTELQRELRRNHDGTELPNSVPPGSVLVQLSRDKFRWRFRRHPMDSKPLVPWFLLLLAHPLRTR